MTGARNAKFSMEIDHDRT